jgi:tetratricopeptide (TPR) repeat protein
MRRLVRAVRAHPWRTVLALLLVGLGGAAGGWYAWGCYHWRAALRALEADDPGQARPHLARCLQVWPRSATVRLLAAQAARRDGACDEAAQILKVCRQLQAPAAALAREHVLLQAQQGDLGAEDEADLLAAGASDEPDAPLILEALTRGYLETHRLAAAYRCVDRLLRLRPDHLAALLWRGSILERLNRFEDALEDYRKALALRPESISARLSLGEVLLHLGRFEESAEHFEDLRRRLPDNAAIQLGLARCRHGLGQLGPARRLVEGLPRTVAREPLVLREKGLLALEEGRGAEAERWLRATLALAPHDREAHYALYNCLKRAGHEDEAARHRAALARLDADLKRLAALSRKAVEAGATPASRCEAGVLCLRLGREEEGACWLRGVLRDAPGYRDAHRALADYYQRIGNPALAARHRQAAAAPSGPK